MRLLALIRGDLRFQWKYGFYFIYAVFTLLYALVLFAVPEPAKKTVATVLIFTDPAATGLFFMGAIVLLEKSQRVNCAIAVTPARTGEYITAKLISLAAIGLLVGLILALLGGTENLLSCALGIVTASALCSLCGLIAAMKVTTLNQFILFAVPFELFICAPPALLLFGIDHPALALHPGVAAVRLIQGDAAAPLFCAMVLLLWAFAAFMLCRRAVRKNFLAMGGAEL